MVHPCRQHSMGRMGVACALGVLALTLQAQDSAPSPLKTASRIDLVLTPDFCATQSKKGDFFTGKETFPIGPMSCPELERSLKIAFPNLKLVDAEPAPGTDAPEVTLIPKFVDVGTTKALGAFSNRELVVLVEWTAKNASGKPLWVETVQGSAKHHMGNLFTARKNRKLIVADAVKDLADNSVNKILAAPELARLHHGAQAGL